MLESSAAPTADGLFHKWKQFLDDGALVTAAQVTSDQPEMTGPLQDLIDDYLAGRASQFEETLTTLDDDPPEPEPLPTIAGFTILKRLGRGGMGEVFHVRDQLNREWALKVARKKQLSAAGRQRFLAEADAMSKLTHPHIAPIWDYKDIDGRPYFTMSLYPNTLADKLPEYRADPKATVRLMAAVAEGVGHLHANGFVHRDLKPSNILLGKDGRPVVSDFGLVKGRTEGDSSAGDSSVHGSAETVPPGGKRSQTLAGLVLGTRRYMAPEQAAGLNHLAGPSWDTWALGVILHELLTGQAPRSSNAPERMLRPNEPGNPPPTDVKPGLDPGLVRIVEHCLARDPALRYPDGASVAADLNSWLKPKRRRSIRAIAATAIAVLIVSTIGIAAARPWRSTGQDLPDKPAAAPASDAVLAGIQQQLKDDKTVTVIDATGMPVWSDLAVGKGKVHPHLSETDKVLVIDTADTALMDLPPTGLDRYRVRVEVCQRSATADSRVGVYAGRHRLPTSNGETEAFASLWFTDNDPEPTADAPGRWQIALRPYELVSRKGSVSGEYGGAKFGRFVPQPDEKSLVCWHVIVIEVTPTGLAFTFDGQSAGTIALPLNDADEKDFTQTVAHVNPGIRSAFSPAGGYGFIVRGGAGGFRNATVSRLP
ncbi:MAG TPA: serine/threonine-protein kinase [Gemmataceae bacterium]|jgi:serine/threonine protein kinase|nr:serine/threonine-protein kinase [Gemmataceae bacterium]